MCWIGTITSADVGKRIRVKDRTCKARSSMSQFVSIFTSASPRSTCAGHAVVQAVERLFQRRRNAEKILPTGILSRSIRGVDPGTHEALNNVRAFLSYQHWRVRHRSFPAWYNIRNNCQRPKRVLMPVEASLGIMATFNRIKNVQEKQWVFPIPFRFHTKLWWLRGSRLVPDTLTPVVMRKKNGIALAASSWRRTVFKLWDIENLNQRPQKQNGGVTFQGRFFYG